MCLYSFRKVVCVYSYETALCLFSDAVALVYIHMEQEYVSIRL